jgi:hypothetical protein
LIRLFQGQCSCSARVDLRRAKLGAKAIGFDFAALPGWRAAQWADDLVGSADLVVIDASPTPRLRGGSRCAQRGSWRLPFSHRRSDPWATVETLKMAQDERWRSLVVLSRAPPRLRLTGDIAADLTGAGTAIAATRMGNRVALARWRWGLASSKTPVRPPQPRI